MIRLHSLVVRKKRFHLILHLKFHLTSNTGAERAKTVGYPERFAQEALGHNSKAVPHACAKRALMKIPSLEDYEQRAATKAVDDKNSPLMDATGGRINSPAATG
jgi:hypothetical protein